ncbi:hypothetical protein CLU79DRAFT_538835, partial [Phycomyces nitens]
MDLPLCLISMSPFLTLTRIPIPEDDRAILAKVSHVSDFFSPFYVLVVYAPASQPTARHTFFSDLLSFPILHRPDILERLFIAGDFNLSFHIPRSLRSLSPLCQEYFSTHFIDCHTHPDHNPLPTFRRNDTIISTIDYIFAPKSFSSSINAASINFVSPSWTDHALLSTTFRFGLSPHGKGLYRTNPLLVNNPTFVSTLTDTLTTLYPTLSSSSQDNWETVKNSVIRTCKRFSGRHVPWRTKQLKKLQSKRHHFLHSSPPPAIRQLV